MAYSKDVPFRWAVVNDHGNWTVRYRAYNSDKGKRVQYSKTLGVKVAACSKEEADAFAECLMKVIAERHLELESARIRTTDWRIVFSGESIASDDSIRKAINKINYMHANTKDPDYAIALARFIELKKLVKDKNGV